MTTSRKEYHQASGKLTAAEGMGAGCGPLMGLRKGTWLGLHFWTVKGKGRAGGGVGGGQSTRVPVGS